MSAQPVLELPAREPCEDVRLSLLGGFGLHVEGERVELPHSAQRVISFLALHPRVPLRRVFVAGCLWTEASEAQANSSLRSALWRLQARAHLVDATGTQVSLEPWVRDDLAALTALTGRLTGDGIPPTRAEVLALTEAGDLLPDWYDDWLIVERERVRQRRLHALEAACRSLTAAGRHADALDAGLAAIAVEPLRETGHAVVIEAHLAEGNLIEASRQYEQLRDLLRQHLGTHPSARVRDLLRDAQVTLA
jgi:DNA-binding SARP family transcriptional activator